MTPFKQNTPLRSGPVHLRFEKVVAAPPEGELVPYLHFKVLNDEDRIVGHINLRIGNTRHVLKYAGHVGYEILPEFRGSSFSYHACMALREVIRNFYHNVILTVDPENFSSIRTIEKLQATFLGVENVPPEDPAYKSGAIKKQRYMWTAE